MPKSLRRIIAVLVAIALTVDPVIAQIGAALSGGDRSDVTMAAVSSQALAPNPTTSRLLLQHSHAFVAAILVSAGLILHPVIANTAIDHSVIQATFSSGWLWDAVMVSIFVVPFLGALGTPDDFIRKLPIRPDTKEILRHEKILTREALLQLTPGDLISMPGMTWRRVLQIKNALAQNQLSLQPDPPRKLSPERAAATRTIGIDVLTLSPTHQDDLFELRIYSIANLMGKTETYLSRHLKLKPESIKEIKRRLWATGRWTLLEPDDPEAHNFPPVSGIFFAPAGAAGEASVREASAQDDPEQFRKQMLEVLKARNYFESEIREMFQNPNLDRTWGLTESQVHQAAHNFEAFVATARIEPWRQQGAIQVNYVDRTIFYRPDLAPIAVTGDADELFHELLHGAEPQQESRKVWPIYETLPAVLRSPNASLSGQIVLNNMRTRSRVKLLLKHKWEEELQAYYGQLMFVTTRAKREGLSLKAYLLRQAEPFASLAGQTAEDYLKELIRTRNSDNLATAHLAFLWDLAQTLTESGKMTSLFEDKIYSYAIGSNQLLVDWMDSLAQIELDGYAAKTPQDYLRIPELRTQFQEWARKAILHAFDDELYRDAGLSRDGRANWWIGAGTAVGGGVGWLIFRHWQRTGRVQADEAQERWLAEQLPGPTLSPDDLTELRAMLPKGPSAVRLFLHAKGVSVSRREAEQLIKGPGSKRKRNDDGVALIEMAFLAAAVGGIGSLIQIFDYPSMIGGVAGAMWLGIGVLRTGKIHVLHNRPTAQPHSHLTAHAA